VRGVGVGEGDDGRTGGWVYNRFGKVPAGIEEMVQGQC